MHLACALDSGKHAGQAGCCQPQSSHCCWGAIEHPLDYVLQGAIDGGAFRVTGSVYDGLPDLPTILLTALEVSRALEYLHSKNILHGAWLPRLTARLRGALQLG